MAYEYEYPKVEQPWKIAGYGDVDPATGFTYEQSYNREQYKEFGYDIGVTNTGLSSANFYANRPVISTQSGGIGVPRTENPNPTIDALIYEGWNQGQTQYQDAQTAQALADFQAKLDAENAEKQRLADITAAEALAAQQAEAARIDEENRLIEEQRLADEAAAAQAVIDAAAAEAVAQEQIITDSTTAVDEEIAAGQTQANLTGADFEMSDEDRQTRIEQVTAEGVIDRQIGFERAYAKNTGVDFNMSAQDRQTRIDSYLGGDFNRPDTKERNIDFSAARSAGMKPLKTLIENLEDEDTLDIMSLLGSP